MLPLFSQYFALVAPAQGDLQNYGFDFDCGDPTYQIMATHPHSLVSEEEVGADMRGPAGVQEAQWLPWSTSKPG